MITVIHPSRGRPRLARKAYDNWLSKAADKNIQWVLSLDTDDKYLSQYKQLFAGIEILINPNKNLVQAVNAAIPYIKGDLVAVVSDDFDCPNEWDTIIGEQQFIFHKIGVDVIDADKNKYAIYINDGITFGRRCMTLPILTKSLIDKLGYIYYPGYTGMFADDDLYQTCEKLGVINTKDILFQHNHWVNGKAVRDATYNRHNTDASWNIGKKLLAERQKRGFDL